MSTLMNISAVNWTVVCQNQSYRFVWLYVFSSNGTVRWKDEGNGMTGNGTWKIHADKLTTRWHNSATVETWQAPPIDPRNWTGTCIMKGVKYNLTAVARNFIEIEPIDIYTRTPESKAQFLQKCNAAVTKVMAMQVRFSGFLSGMSIAYANAFEAHNKVVNDIDATEKLAEDMLLGVALAFVGGGIGGVVGGVVKQAMAQGKVADFMIDGIKDIAKFAVRGPGAALFRQPGIKRIPDSPLQWQNAYNERVMKEMAPVIQNIYYWQTAVASDDDSFDASFDPIAEVDRLSIGGVSLFFLPMLDDETKATIQRSCEQGWLKAWIEKKGMVRISTASPLAFAQLSNRQKLSQYGQRVGVNDIEALLDKYWPIYDADPMP